MPPTIRNFLDLSTAHLPGHFWHSFDRDADAPRPTGWHPTDVGALLWVPCDVACDEYGPNALPEIVAVREYARQLGCDYILFDRDAEIDPNLPTWEPVDEPERNEPDPWAYDHPDVERIGGC